jgi:hypothetical protein
MMATLSTQVAMTGKVVYRGKEVKLPAPFLIIFVGKASTQALEPIMVCC